MSFTLNSLSDTNALAGCFASCLRQGDIVGLTGGLGVGKSAFARAAILSQCDDIEDVPSPTFTLVQQYQTRTGLDVWHMDLYRLQDPEEVFALGVEEAFIEAACLVEWPEMMGHFWPKSAIMIAIERAEDESRSLHIDAPDAFIEKLEKQIRNKAPHLLQAIVK